MQRILGIRTRLDSADSNSILLTFDDGPDPSVTGRVLDELEKHGAKAVFFVVGNRISKAEHMLSEVLDRGHILGNHSHCHWLEKPPGLKEYTADLLTCQERVFDVCGYTPTLYRPPLGAVTAATVLASRKLGFEVCKWSLDTNDWRLRDDDDARSRGIEAASEVRQHDIILMHDNNAHTPALLSELLPRLQKTGLNMHSYVDKYKETHPSSKKAA